MNLSSNDIHDANRDSQALRNVFISDRKQSLKGDILINCMPQFHRNGTLSGLNDAKTHFLYGAVRDLLESASSVHALEGYSVTFVCHSVILSFCCSVV